MSSVNTWKPDSYDSKLAFVSEYGKSLVELLNPKKNELILDLGCGTGDLTYEISKAGAKVSGVDYSEAMIETARRKYPQLAFQVGNGEALSDDKSYDAVFSNAALHWMKNAADVVRSVHRVLKQDGRFVAEFGGKGNVNTILQAIYEVLGDEYSLDATKLNPWYFPSIGEYSSLLESEGFRVEYARLYERPTQLPDGQEGLASWLANFGGDFFQQFSAADQSAIYAKLKAKLIPKLWRDGSLYADYVRLTVVAIKNS
ncbi:trans-aconitate 2-methyltransferase [Paenibacillus sp. J22TS3]|uniref:class I SAM-dependent methyltransferase n=1 Tax=Paenibacillus sp. J22TS3 TaxID=2807192 RepID=UPI001AFD8CC7|nr:class I SAM-dependent methyltransferase [Paenibacillus sp. J22TS3]GIP22464.1 SAM-dependent methyltransferase [Paenibacillus sp. J22TS3]